jgi:hypothetical protein
LRTIQPRGSGRNLIPVVAVLRARCHGVPPMSGGAIGVARSLRQVPLSSTHGREACAQGLAGRDRSTRRSTNGRPESHEMCFASSSNRMRRIGKGRSVLSAISAYQKLQTRSTGVFRVGALLKLFRSTSCKQGTVPFRPPSWTQPTYAISIGHPDGAQQN